MKGAARAQLERIKDRCIWTEPTDPSLEMDWQDFWKSLQNVKKDKDNLARRITGYYITSLSAD